MFDKVRCGSITHQNLGFRLISERRHMMLICMYACLCRKEKYILYTMKPVSDI